MLKYAALYVLFGKQQRIQMVFSEKRLHQLVQSEMTESTRPEQISLCREGKLRISLVDYDFIRSI